MPALHVTDYFAEVVWLGKVANREAKLNSVSCTSLKLLFSGPEGENHGGETRLSCSRVLGQYRRGTPIRNTRQLSIASEEELSMIAKGMGIDALDPSWLGLSMVIRGIDDFSHVPPSTRMQNEAGTTITVDILNRPCHLPAKVIEEYSPDKGKAIRQNAQDRRGVTGWVEREGIIALGDVLRFHMPTQREWRGGAF